MSDFHLLNDYACALIFHFYQLEITGLDLILLRNHCGVNRNDIGVMVHHIQWRMSVMVHTVAELKSGLRFSSSIRSGGPIAEGGIFFEICHL